MAKKDYYEILGISKTASKDEVKKAFHKMAHKYHPDKKDGDEAKFKEANEAYQILSDDQKRSQYDQYGQTFDGAQAGGFGGQQGFGGFDFSQGGFDMGDLNDIFSEFFTGGGVGRRASRRGRDISTELTISFEEAVFGVVRRILITKQSTCGTCTGSGAKPGSATETCKKCNGKGQVRETKQSFFGSFASVVTCDECEGSGKIPKEKCSDCRGSGVVKGQQEIEVNIPAGIDNGEMIRMQGMGEAVSHGETGDLYIKINVMKHPIFKRDGSNLYTDLTVNLTDALLGSEFILKTLDGDVKVKVPEGITHGESLRVKEKGVPTGRGQKRGDILIKILIKMPTKLSRKAKEAIEELKKEGI